MHHRPDGWKHVAVDVAGKAVVVSGGATGVGRTIVKLFVSLGSRVLFFAQNELEIRDAICEVKAFGEVSGIAADASTEAGVKNIFAEADRVVGGVDILINNPALPARGIMQAEPAQWEYLFDTNLLGYMYCAHEALERMRRRGHGHIVNINLPNTEMRGKGEGVYAATRAGIVSWNESLRKAVNSEGIRVSLVEPGEVSAELGNGNIEKRQKLESELKTLTAEDVAEFVLYAVTRPLRCNTILLQVRPHRQSLSGNSS